MPLIQEITFSYGPGSATDVHELDAFDLSRYDVIRFEIVLTTADTDAGDTLDVRLQSTSDRIKWHTRARSTQKLGTLSPSATAPEYENLIVRQTGQLSATEEVYEPSGSAGAVEIAAGQVLNGPFPSKYRDTTERKWKPNWRIHYTFVDSDNDGAMAGVYRIWGVSNTNLY